MKTAVVSASGKFYGSEQVLFDWLTTCEDVYDVYVPANSEFETLLKRNTLKHRILSFRSVYSLYFQIAIRIITGSLNTIYQNEGGHIRYCLALSKLFKTAKFVIHLRILEDIHRVPDNSPQNVSYVTISNYMSRQMIDQGCKMVHDPFHFNQNFSPTSLMESDCINVGIIGRISEGKGLQHIVDLCRQIRKTNENIQLHLFGQRVVTHDTESMHAELDMYDGKEIILHGFTDKSQIYTSIDVVLHLAKKEPLGRIFFEALNELKPFVGFQSGGIGELSEICNNATYFLSAEDRNLSETILTTIKRIASEYVDACNVQIKSKHIAIKQFDQKSYNQVLSQLII